MEPKDFYKFCPKCSGKLKQENERFLLCQKCGFHFYVNPVPTNAVILENEKGEIMLVKRRVEPKKGYWDWPGGFIEPNESLEDSVRREIKEELGVEVEKIRIVGVYSDNYLFQGLKYPMLGIAVSAKITGGEIKAADDILEYRYFPAEEILKMELAFENIKQGISDYLNSDN